MQCWCQNGNIECRQYFGTIFDSMDMWGDGTAAYVIAIVVIVVILFGTLLCCSCTLFFYYYYKRNQAAFQQAYDQYLGTPGWQPMGDEEAPVDDSAENKPMEAEQGQFDSEQYLAQGEQAKKTFSSLYATTICSLQWSICIRRTA